MVSVLDGGESNFASVDEHGLPGSDWWKVVWNLLCSEIVGEIGGIINDVAGGIRRAFEALEKEAERRRRWEARFSSFDPLLGCDNPEFSRHPLCCKICPHAWSSPLHAVSCKLRSLVAQNEQDFLLVFSPMIDICPVKQKFLEEHSDDIWCHMWTLSLWEDVLN